MTSGAIWPRRDMVLFLLNLGLSFHTKRSAFTRLFRLRIFENQQGEADCTRIRLGARLRQYQVFPFSPLAFPGSTPDEHLSSTQRNDWTCNEPAHKRGATDRLSASPKKTTFVQSGGTAPQSEFFRDQTGRSMGEQTDL
jgi:hypothetical protein